MSWSLMDASGPGSLGLLGEAYEQQRALWANSDDDVYCSKRWLNVYFYYLHFT